MGKKRFRLTEEEKKAISLLRELEAVWPKRLWLFAGDGVLYAMRKNRKGERVERPDHAVDQDYIVDRFYGIGCDGGGWVL